MNTPNKFVLMTKFNLSSLLSFMHNTTLYWILKIAYIYIKCHLRPYNESILPPIPFPSFSLPLSPLMSSYFPRISSMASPLPFSSNTFPHFLSLQFVEYGRGGMVRFGWIFLEIDPASSNIKLRVWKPEQLS